MRLIDADRIKFEVFAIIENYSLNPVYSSDYKCGWNDAVNALEKQIAELPTIKRPHGTWVDVPKYKGFYVCSKCLERLDGDFERFDHWEMKKDNFCSGCGADMRKEGEAE